MGLYEDFSDFRKQYLEDNKNDAIIDGSLPGDFFFQNEVNRLSGMGEFVDPYFVSVQKKCRNNKTMSFDAYAFDDVDKSVILIANDFDGFGDSILTKADIEIIKTRMLNFLQEAYDEKLKTYFDMTDDMLPIGNSIGVRMHKTYVDYENDNSIDKIKLYIVTNRILSERVKTLDCEDFLEKKVELNIWSISRLYDYLNSGKSKEPIVIKTQKYGYDGIPCIKAEMSGNEDYEAYLAIIPGELLHKIYYDKGSRLLEGNIRAFLSNRGKVNKGIRATIKDEPTKFFTYNNGIACTASRIEFTEDKKKIEEIEDLQIINGGQTTASLTSAVLKDKRSLEGIFVPMKLTIVKDTDEYNNVIANIAKYANSQNKVKDSDLFSNHPFHRLFEDLSKKYSVAAHDGQLFDTYWYYERSRGRYEQEQFRFSKKSEADAFASKYPKNQLLKKEELAKYYTAASLLRPDIVCKGSEKCMSAFAEKIDKRYEEKPESFGKTFFIRAICCAILFRETDKIVKDASWYNVGGYKLNIVPYTVSKLVASIPKGYSLDYDLIWRKQALYPELRNQINLIAQITNRFIQQSNGIIVTEYCKKEETWNKYKEMNFELEQSFLKSLSNIDDYIYSEKSDIKEKKLENDINILNEIFKFGSSYWCRLIEEGSKRNILTPTEIDLLSIPANKSKTKVPSDKQAKFIWATRDKLADAGVEV